MQTTIREILTQQIDDSYSKHGERVVVGAYAIDREGTNLRDDYFSYHFEADGSLVRRVQVVDLPGVIDLSSNINKFYRPYVWGIL